ncbi:MAG: hypothetical protein M1825_005574 [Sarcosagium campestre]|nr:MAG: hypothetical protein M1825_005574 [Sarcosagium campestre]
MAWQSPSSLGGNAVPGGGAVDGNPNQTSQPQGTEYTLQGVMRFLQTEWHRHERDRNAWEIERAEMKARIAKLEGENRSSKKMQDSFSKHIQMLESALRRERENFKAAKDKAGANGEGAEESEQTSKSNDKAEASPLQVPSKPPTKQHNSFLDVVSDAASPYRQDSHRQKSHMYLEKSLQEITYLLTPPSHPPLPLQQQQQHHHHHPQHQQQQQQQQQHQHENVGGASADLVGGQGSNEPQQTSQHALDEAYNDQNQPPRHLQGIGINRIGPSLNQQYIPSQSGTDVAADRMQQASLMSRNNAFGNQGAAKLGAFPGGKEQPPSRPQQASHSTSRPSSDDIERVTHSYDSFGRPIPTVQEGANAGALLKQEEEDQEEEEERGEEETVAGDPDGWNFDEPVNEAHPNPLPRNPDTDIFPDASSAAPKSPPRSGPGSHRRKGSMSRRRSSDEAYRSRDALSSPAPNHLKADSINFRVRFALRGHLDVVRAVIFTGGGSPSEPEICTTGDDGVIKRWIIPANYNNNNGVGAGSNNDLDITSYFTHRGHTGTVTALAACPASSNFSTGGRAAGDGWVFSGGQDASLRVWERGRVDAKATLDGHSDAIWSVCVLPTTSAAIFGNEGGNWGGGGASDRIVLASAAADGTIKIWTVSAPPQLSSPHSGSRRGVGGRRRDSVTSGSGFPSSPQPSTATTTPFHHSLVRTIVRPDVSATPTCISPLSVTGENFVVSFNDASILIFDTRTGEEIVGMASQDTYDGTAATGVNSVVATSLGLEGSSSVDPNRGPTDDESLVHGATGSSGGVDGVVISGHEDQYIRFFDANSGQCTYTMLAHPSAISSLSLSPDGRELVSAGHNASLRFWSLEKRSCTQDITSHRLMRGEGVCTVVWSQDGRWVVSGGGDGVVKVFSR